MVGNPYTPPGRPNRASLPRDATPSQTMVRNPSRQSESESAAVPNRYLMEVLNRVQQQVEPHDRVLELARHTPALIAEGLGREFLDQLDLSNAGMAEARAALAPPKNAPTVWEMGLVQPKSKAWRPPIVPVLTEEQLREYDRTDEMLGFPPGQSRRQIQKEDGGPGVRSHAGAMGRAQVMPTTLDNLNAERRKRGLRPWDPDNDDDAIGIHREVMGQNMRMYHDPAAALAAYNGGTDPTKWKGMGETRNYVEYITQKPFPEGLGMRRPQR